MGSGGPPAGRLAPLATAPSLKRNQVAPLPAAAYGSAALQLPPPQPSPAPAALSTPAASTPLPAPETAAPAKSVRIVLSPPGPATPGVQGAGAQSSDPRAPLLTAQYSGAASLGPARSGDVESPQAGTSSLFSTQRSEVKHSTTEGGKPVENFIPFRFPDLRAQLADDFHDTVFRNEEVKLKFFRLCKWMSARNTMRLALQFNDVHDKYSYVDPDNDSEDPGAGRMTQEDKRAIQLAFEQELLSVLDKGEYDLVSEEDFEASKSSHGVRGVLVEECDQNIIEFKMWYRGIRAKEVPYRSWRTLWRKKYMPTQVYQRLALLFKLRPQEEIDAYLESKEQSSLAGKCHGCSRRFCCGICVGKSVKLTDSEKVQQGYTYLKLFKDVDRADLDMLLPGAKAKFTWFDWSMIWGPIVFGVGAAIYKAATGTITFDTLVDIILSLVLIVMPITWGFRAYLAVKDKMAEYQAYLNDLILTHNLDNNAGVVSGVLDEAQEQEDNEAMLAYFFLWRGLKSPTPMSKLELDKAVETYLTQLIEGLTSTAEHAGFAIIRSKAELGIVLDFEVTDSINKLEAMGILTVSHDEKGTTLLTVLPLDEAADKAHIRNFDERRELRAAAPGRLASGAQTMKGMQAPSAWRECVGVYPATGQKFRYYWNEETGESTYIQPTSYMPTSGALPSPSPAPASLTPHTSVHIKGIPPAAAAGATDLTAAPSVVALTQAGAGSAGSVPAAQLLLTQAVRTEAGAPLPHVQLPTGPAPAHVSLPSALNSIPITAPPAPHAPVIR